MHSGVVRAAVVFALSSAVVGCSGGPPPQRHEDEWHAPVEILLRYADKDGKLTRAQLEAGLRKDFDAADLNHDGVLEPDEVRAVNQQRWTEDKSAISPLQDWNGDGVVDFGEFAANARPLFRQFDRNGDGVLTPDELRPGKAGAQTPESTDQQQGEGGRRGRRGGPPSGGPPGGGGPQN
jgi:Ca2+-binding EF-hand superfamily protein